MSWIKAGVFLTIVLLLFSGCSTKYKDPKTGKIKHKSYPKRSSTTTSSSAPPSSNGTHQPYANTDTMPYISKNHPTMNSYRVMGQHYYPRPVNKGDVFHGVASWYGPNFNGKKTSNGEIYNMWAFTAAHKTMPMHTVVKVTNLDNGKSVRVRINDRGPFVKSRIIDLSKSAAYAIDMTQKGTANVRLDVLGFLDPKGKVKKRAKLTAKPQESTNVPKLTQGGSKKVYVQIGSFSMQEGAYAYKERYELIGHKYEATIKVAFINGDNVFKVLLEGFEDEQQARNFIDTNAGFENAFIVRE